MESSENAASLGLVPSQVSNNARRSRRRNPRKKNKAGNGKNPTDAGTNQQEEAKPPPEKNPPNQKKKGKRNGGGNHPTEGGGTTNQQEESPPKQETPPNQKKKARRNRNKKGKKYPWRRYLPPGSRDPITIESLASLEYPPFALAASEPYVPVVEWPVPEPEESKEEQEKKQTDDEKMSPKEWERQIIQQQWGDAAGVIPSQEQETQSETATNEQDVPPHKRHYNLFDGRALAYYLVSQLQFIDPFNRRDLTRDELVNLDAYLVRHGFNDLKVTEAYDAKGVTLSTAGAAGNTAEGRAAILQQEANALLHNIVFGSNELQRQYAASQRRQQQQPSNTRRNRRQEAEDTGIYGDNEGGFVIIDDDANPGLRGRNVSEQAEEASVIPGEISSAPSTTTLWSSNRISNNMSHSARSQAQNFPALPTPAAATDSSSSSRNSNLPSTAAPSKSLQRITQVVKPTDPAQIRRQKEAREEAQRRAMMANLNYMAPGTSVPTEIFDGSNVAPGLLPVPATGASSQPTSGQIKRNQAMASALGVMPATVRLQVNAGWARPTDVKLELDEFGNELNAAQYPDSLIQEAQERMDQVLKLERRWKTFLADDKSASLPLRPMDRPLRTFVHHYSDFWNLHTESFDREPKRYINCVKLRETRVPVPLLSEVARKWRGPAPIVLPRGPRELTISEETPKQAAGQTTSSREFPPAPQREPLKLKPRTVPVEEDAAATASNTEVSAVAPAAPATTNAEDSQLNTRFDSLFTGRERPKLELAARTVPLELPPFEPPKTYDVNAERERQRAAAADKARKKREADEQKAKILAYAFASSDEESLASAGGSSDWEEEEQQYSGSDEEEQSRLGGRIDQT